FTKANTEGIRHSVVLYDTFGIKKTGICRLRAAEFPFYQSVGPMVYKASSISRSELSKFNEVADRSCWSCSTDVALAIGPPIWGWAASRATATVAGAPECFSAILSSAANPARPLALR